MVKVYFAVGVGEKPPHITEIKMAARKISIPSKPRLNRDFNLTIEIESSGKPIFLTYQFHKTDEEISIYVKNAKLSTKKRKR
jgi:hypothetical protein